MSNFTETLQNGFYQTFILDNNYQYFLNGIKITLIVAFVALFFGLIIGAALALIRSAHDQQGSRKRNPVLGFFNLLARLYLTVIRGTPTMVQLLIMWFVLWASARSTDRNLIICAIMAFSINSGAYIAEIIRSGIMAVDGGQMEAGRSLGMNYSATMRHIILPQAFKNALPALGNEMITLLKETSIVTVIGLKDLTKGAMIIQGKTYQALVPFFAIAAIYLAMVMLLTWILGIVERRMRQSDYR